MADQRLEADKQSNELMREFIDRLGALYQDNRRSLPNLQEALEQFIKECKAILVHNKHGQSRFVND